MSNVPKTTVGAKVLAKLEANPEFIDKMTAAIMDGLDASVMVYTKGEPAGTPKADGRTRLEAFKLAMAYSEGLPLQRIIQANIGQGMAAKNVEELAQGIATVPELAAAFRRELDRAEKSAGRPKQKPAIPAG